MGIDSGERKYPASRKARKSVSRRYLCVPTEGIRKYWTRNKIQYQKTFNNYTNK